MDHLDVLVIGSHSPGLRVDVGRLPEPGETVASTRMHWPVDGGKGSNQAIVAARLGATVGFVGCIGDDEQGRAGLSLLKQEGVDTRHLRIAEGVDTGTSVMVVDRAGVPMMMAAPGANAHLNLADTVDALEAWTVKVAVTQFEIDPQTAMASVATAHREGAVSVVNAAPARVDARAIHAWAHEIDWLVVNETEALTILGPGSGGAPTADRLASEVQAATGIANTVVTLGKDGIAARLRESELRLEALPVVAVDSSGAGDAFCGALAVAIARGDEPTTACTWAIGVAAESVTREGTVPSFPYLEATAAANS